MAHLLDMTNNRANMAYVGDTPWHGLGEQLQPNMPLENWRVAAGMDWDCLKLDESFTNPENGRIVTTGDSILVRGDSMEKLGNCKEGYKIVQPSAVLEFFRDLTEEHGFIMDTAGCLDGGRKVWALAKIGEPLRIMGQDVINQYCLLATSFDGSLATQARITSVRVVCNNTLTCASAERTAMVQKIRHNTDFKEHKVKMDLGIISDVWADFGISVEKLARKKLSKESAVELLLESFGIQEGSTISTKQNNILHGVLNKFQGAAMGAQFESAKGTAWGLVNSITEFVDHEQGNNANNRLRSQWFGEGEKLKNKAFQLALQAA